MSFANLCGDSVLADARLLALDGFIFPFHRLIFHVAPEDRQLKNCDFQSYINSQYQDGQTPIPLVFDAQTVWRLLCFIYDGTYQDEDKHLTFPKVDALDFPPSANELNDEPLEHQEVELIRSLHNLHITSQSCKSEVLVKALNSAKVFRAAFMWNLDRLMVEAAHRFGEFISGAFNQPEFPQIIAPVFNSVVDPQCMLYGHLVQECFAHCQELVNNDKFITALEHNGKLAVQLYEKLAKLQASLGHANMAGLPHASFISESSGSGTPVDASAVTLLQSQLTEALDAATSKQEQVNALKQEVTRLEKTCTEFTALDSAKQGRINTLEQEAARAKENAPQKASTNLEAQIQKLLAQKNAKDAVIDNLEHQLEEKDRKTSELDRALQNANALNMKLSQQINEQRVGKRDNTNFLLERNEALENAGKLQTRVTEFEDKIKELEGQLTAHVQHVPQPPTSNGTLDSRSLQSGAQDAEPRRVKGFGSMANSVNAMIAASSGAPTRPPSPLSAPPVTAAPTLAAQVPISRGAPTFYEKMELKKRQAAAGITGGEADAPPGMPSARRLSIFSFPDDQNPSPTVGVPGQPRTNGMTQHVAPRSNAVPIVDPARAVPVARAVAPVAPAAAAAPAQVAPVAPTATTSGNGAPDARDKTIKQLQKQVDYLQCQLTDRRNGPGSTAQTRVPPAHANTGNDNRLVRVLGALRDYCVDHRSCNDCGINFNAQFRGIVENIDDRHLILKCGKCDSEKCRFPC